MRAGLETKVTGNTLPADEWDDVPSELKNLIEGSGQTLTTGDLEMLEKAVTSYAMGAEFYATSGSATTVQLDPVGTRSLPGPLKTGMLVRWRPAETCPGGNIFLRVGAIQHSLKDESGANLEVSAYDANHDAVARFNETGTVWQLVSSLQLHPTTNYIDNSDFGVWSHIEDANPSTAPLVTSACLIPQGGNANYDIPVDRWHLVSGDAGGDVNDVVDVERITAAQSGSVITNPGWRGAIRLTVNNASDKFGILQNVSAIDSAAIFDGAGTAKCTLSFYTRVGAGTEARMLGLKAAVIASSAAYDSLPISPVSAWGATGVTPTLVANQVFQNTPASLGSLSAGVWQRHEIQDILISKLATHNLRVMIWLDDPGTGPTQVGDTLWISAVKLEVGSQVTDYEPKSYATEDAACKLHYQHFGKCAGVTDATRCAIPGTVAYTNTQNGAAFVLPIARMLKAPIDANIAFSPVADFAVANFNDVAFNYGLVDVLSVGATGFVHSRDAVMFRIEANGRFTANEASYFLKSGGAADPDGFIDAGVHVRSDI